MFFYHEGVKLVDYMFLVLEVSKQLSSIEGIVNNGCHVVFGSKKYWIVNGQNPTKE
jgi:hypothetical protein